MRAAIGANGCDSGSPPTPPFRREGAKVSPDGVLGDVEFESEFRRDHGSALGQAVEDDIASSERGFKGQETIPKQG